MTDNQDLVQLFEEMAKAISIKHQATVKIASVRAGGRPPFDILMKILKELEQELSKTGASLIEDHLKTTPGTDIEVLTEDVRQRIAGAIETFVKQL